MDSFFSDLKEKAEEEAGSLVNQFSGGGGGGEEQEGGGEETSTDRGLMDLKPRVEEIIANGRACHQTAKECVEICHQSEEKRQQMMAFADEIVDTLKSLSNAQDAASVLSTIQELTKGERVREAEEIAKSCSEMAVQCVEKAVTMIDLMDKSVELLPSFIRDKLNDDDEEPPAQEGEEPAASGERDLELLGSVDTEIGELKECVQAIMDLNLVTCVKVGKDAFQHLSAKAQRTHALFDEIRDFASDVCDLSAAFDKMQVLTIARESKEIAVCLKKTKSLRAVAQGASTLVAALIELFDATADRVSALWSALGKAKDVMLESLEIIELAKASCTQAREKSCTLLEQSKDVGNQLEGIEVNKDTLEQIRQLGNDIQQAVDLAQSMDDFVLDCSSKVVSMVEHVSTSFKELPDILTDGIDVKEQGKQDDDPEPVAVDDNIAALEQAKREMDESNILDATKTATQGFRGLSTQVTSTTGLLDSMDNFTTDCGKNIDLFLKVWDLDEASSKITEMCRLVNLGELYQHFAEQVKKLILAMIDFMKTCMDKLANLDLGDILGGGGDLVQDIAGAIGGDGLGNVIEGGQDLIEGAMGGGDLNNVIEGGQDLVEDLTSKFNFFGK